VSLNEIWFALFVLIIAGYLILDGFDIGVGITHLLVAKTDDERRITLNSIGPVWDGNEVWIVLAGGVLFAAFPLVYASLFSGFYLAFMLVLLVLILRTVAIEFRSKRAGERWRRNWDVIFSLSSLGLALLLGLAFGNIIAGVDLDEQGNINESLIDLITPYALLLSVAAVSMFALHGLLYLAMKSEGELERRVRGFVPKAMLLFFILATLVVIATALFEDEVSDVYLSDVWPIIFPAAALVAFALVWRMFKQGDDFRAFAASAAMIGFLIVSGGVGMYPNLLISSQNRDHNLTIDNAASADNTLTVMLVFALIGIPLVLLYTSGIYYFFRGKTQLGPDSY
jgi:cytochrome bd ubiquinol oxidase subunit II